MGKIVILDENTSNKIAAGEVIEKPASVVKELVENSIDAGAGNISVEIRNGGISLIKVTDNGSGIDEDDAEIAFERHATSKIRSADDLDAICSLGFRGEALASIAAVSTIELTTRVKKNTSGTFLRIQGGIVKEVKQTGCPIGTTIIIRDLFYNTPARFKFLKKDVTEAGYISDIINRIALGNPGISLKLMSNGDTVLHTPGNNELISAIFSVYGKETARDLCEINYISEFAEITGCAGKPEIARSNRNHQSYYLNGRYIKSKLLTSAVDEAYKTFLMKNKYPFIVMNLKINPALVDVNVHPGKTEVRFSDEQAIFRGVMHALTNALQSKQTIKDIRIGLKATDSFSFTKNTIDINHYTQQDMEIGSRIIKENDDVYKYDAAGWQPAENAMVKVSDSLKVSDSIKESVILATDSNEDHIWKRMLLNSKIIGQAFSTYIILQNNDEMILIDQHAAHERIMFSRLKNRFMDNEPLSQVLITPIVIELTYQEVKLIEDGQEFFKKIGFIFENFGNNSIILRSVPYTCDTSNVNNCFLSVIDHVTASKKQSFNIITDDVLYTIACKSAVKAKQRLDDAEIENLLKDLAEIENPFTCPHGRPTMLKMSKYDVEKMFKRIV